MKKCLLIVGCLALWCATGGAQNIYLYPLTPSPAMQVPAGTYQTETAVITNQNRKTVLFTTTCGTIVGTNPTIANEPATVALYSATAQGPCTVTATSTSNSSLHTSTEITFTASPTPATTHPRLYITQSMLSGLQAKAATGSPMYTALHGPTGEGYTAAEYYAQLSTGTYINNYTVYNWSWSCEGGTGLPTSGSASPYGLAGAASTFAFMALVNPNTSTGTNWGCYGHDVMMYIINQFNAGTYTPGQDEVRNQAAGLGFTVDWLLGSGAISTSGDITAARTYTAGMLKYIMVHYLNGWYPGASTAPGWYNSSNMFPAITDVRNLGNNYSETRFFLIPALALTFNDTTLDDPPLTNTCSATRYQVCPDWSAGSMHAYFTYFDGGILYAENLHLEDPNVTWQAYQAAYANLPTQPQCLDWQGSSGIGSGYIPCFGDGRGGESSEGNGYGYSLWGVRAGLNLIWTAGYADPLVYGPQVSLETSSFWDLHNVAQNEFLTGMQKYNTNPSGAEPSYGVINTGDESFYQTFPNYFGVNTATMVFDTYTGRTDRTAALEWPVLNTAYGGPAGTALGCSGYCGFNTDMTILIANNAAQDFFIALPAADPVASPPADPRPSMPYDLWNGSYNQHQMVRTGFTNTDSLVSITCGNTLIDHEHPNCGRIEVYSNNEFITKGRTTFDDYNQQMSTTQQQNTLSPLTGQGSCGTPTSDQQFWWACAQGGQWQHGQQTGFALPLHSELPTYAANITDMTGVANQYSQSLLVTGASRSTIVLKGSKQVIFYDRAVSGVAQEKADYLNTTGTPTITGNQVKWTTQSGLQDAYLTAVLPSTLAGRGGQLVNGTITTPGSSCGSPSISITGSGAAWPYQNLGPQWMSVEPGGGYASAPTPVWSGCTGVVSNTTVNSLTNVLNDVGLTQAEQMSGTNNDWEVVDTVQVNAGVAEAANFLNVLEWGAHSFTKSTTTLVNSSAGQPFQGVLVGTTLVMFSQAYPFTFTITTFAPAGATTIYVSDLSPNTTYPATGAGVPATVTTDTAGVAVFAAAGTGNITLGSGTPAADPPTFSPPSGTYTGAQAVTISSTSAGAIKCYNFTGAPATNGTTGCTTGTLYTVPVSVSSTSTLYAVAGGTGWLDSSVASASYTITTPTAATPTFSPVAGTYAGTQSVTLSTATSGCGGYLVWNTTNAQSGGNLTGTSSTNPLTVSSSETVYAQVQSCPSYANSLIGSAAYMITAPPGSSATLMGIGVVGWTVGP